MGSRIRSRGVDAVRCAVPAEVCARLRASVLAEAGRFRPLARVAELFGMNKGVRSPWKRSHVALPWTDDVSAAVNAAARALEFSGVWEAAGLTRGAELVELSAMVAEPGAAAQAAHTDVPPDAATRTCTMWIALQRVDEARGPTVYYPLAPDETATRYDWAALARRASRPTVYGPDGEAVPDLSPPETVDAPAPFADVDPVALTADAGDVFLMDCRTFHFGAANSSDVPRAQLSATFRDGDVDESGDGFTYRLGDDVPRLRLGDLLAAAPPR